MEIKVINEMEAASMFNNQHPSYRTSINLSITEEESKEFKEFALWHLPLEAQLENSVVPLTNPIYDGNFLTLSQLVHRSFGVITPDPVEALAARKLIVNVVRRIETLLPELRSLRS